TRRGVGCGGREGVAYGTARVRARRSGLVLSLSRSELSAGRGPAPGGRGGLPRGAHARARQMASGTAGGIAPDAIPIGKYTSLNRQQIVGFRAAWFGWMLDGMDSVIYALVLGPALTELLPRSGMPASPANIGFVGSIMFALF